jgi:hypothetical protein
MKPQVQRPALYHRTNSLGSNKATRMLTALLRIVLLQLGLGLGREQRSIIIPDV